MVARRAARRGDDSVWSSTSSSRGLEMRFRFVRETWLCKWSGWKSHKDERYSRARGREVLSLSACKRRTRGVGERG